MSLPPAAWNAFKFLRWLAKAIEPPTPHRIMLLVTPGIAALPMQA